MENLIIGAVLTYILLKLHPLKAKGDGPAVLDGKSAERSSILSSVMEVLNKGRETVTRSVNSPSAEEVQYQEEIIGDLTAGGGFGVDPPRRKTGK